MVSSFDLRGQVEFGDRGRGVVDDTGDEIGVSPGGHQTVEKHIENCTQADPADGEGVRKACEAFGAL